MTAPTTTPSPTSGSSPVRAMGYKPVYDDRVDQLGRQAGTHGAIFVEGRWYCPSMPEPLINAIIDLRRAHRPRGDVIKLIAARRGYHSLSPTHDHRQPRSRHQAVGRLWTTAARNGR